MCHFIISVSASERSLQIPISFRVPLKIERSNSWVYVAQMMHSWWKKRMKPWIYPLWFLSESAVGTSFRIPYVKLGTHLTKLFRKTQKWTLSTEDSCRRNHQQFSITRWTGDHFEWMAACACIFTWWWRSMIVTFSSNGLDSFGKTLSVITGVISIVVTSFLWNHQS